MGDGLIGEASHLSRNLETLWKDTHSSPSAGWWGGGSGQRVEHQGKLTGGHALGCTHDQPGD